MDRQMLLQALREFPQERTTLLPALHLAQDMLGCLPPWAMETVGEWLHVPKSEVYGAATSYANFRFAPPPRHCIKVCCGASCHVNGSARLLKKLEDSLGVREGETTADGNLSLEKSDCLFVCSVAPAIEVDGITQGRTTEAKLVESIKELAERD